MLYLGEANTKYDSRCMNIYTFIFIQKKIMYISNAQTNNNKELNAFVINLL